MLHRVRLAQVNAEPLAGRNVGRLERVKQRAIMTKLQALEEEIEKLSPGELAELQEWLAEREADAWDREIERDASSGKLDKLFEKSVADHRAGKSREN
jgi:hypothetical protein